MSPLIKFYNIWHLSCCSFTAFSPSRTISWHMRTKPSNLDSILVLIIPPNPRHKYQERGSEGQLIELLFKTRWNTLILAIFIIILNPVLATVIGIGWILKELQLLSSEVIQENPTLLTPITKFFPFPPKLSLNYLNSSDTIYNTKLITDSQ